MVVTMGKQLSRKKRKLLFEIEKKRKSETKNNRLLNEQEFSVQSAAVRTKAAQG